VQQYRTSLNCSVEVGGDADVEAHVQIVRRNVNMLSAGEGEGNAEHLKQRNTKDYVQIQI